MRKENKKVTGIQETLEVTKGQAERLAKDGVTPDDATRLKSARLKKLLVETAKLEEQLSILKKEHIPVVKVRENGLRAGSLLKAELTALSSSLPPLLSGLTEPEMQPVIDELVHKTLSDFVYVIERII